ncbi:DNA repair protein RecN [Lawsonella clevelandensis]|uniref:DNA repair protein RecN n=1 Tax=Lawsonella clevelandensis TaxID=1528099 RepID=A0A0M4MM84_9ACTN|nr:DNA repair protein RecN [Lawsonella clevelandensis]ALE19503.1 hypothetical protein AL705_08200 [Lawsonella clevelandensis]ALE35180.1 hypothetical protein IY73_08165 [Lawsonella clevelandensis]VHO01725.1 DNA repair protein RecN [Lawsonella clevelandensis]
MLSELRITNLGVIAETDVELHNGLTVITGETGAGKTMLVSSLQLLTGQRADSSKVRHTAPGETSEARVEGRFEAAALPSGVADQTRSVVTECGAQADDDGSVIVLRTVRSDGRSRAHLGGRSVPAGTLASFAQPLLAIHGQHDQLRLLNSRQQREALDRFGGDEVRDLLSSYRTVWHHWRERSRELHERQTQGQQRAREFAQLTQAVDEIEKAALCAGEDYQLQEDIRRLMDADELRETASRANYLLSGDAAFLAVADQQPGCGVENPPAAIDAVGQTRDALHNSSDSTLHDWSERLDEALSIIEDVSSDLHAYLEELNVDPAVLEEKLARQAMVKAIVRKYGVDVDAVLRWKDEAESRIAELDTSETTLDELRDEVAVLRDELRDVSRALTSARKKAARRLQHSATAVLHTLAMEKANFSITVAPLAGVDARADSARSFADSGADDVTFLLAANAGATPQPIAKAASGGELSRVMLALEVVLAQDDYGRTLIFDEVDSGIGGSTALEIGRCLSRLARIHQVLVVTHLPQVAAFADHHLTVTKDNSGTSAETTVVDLDDEARIAELARMLAGMGDTETGKAHAKELWATASSLKSADWPT